MRNLILKTLEVADQADKKYLEGYCMFNFGISKRDAREELDAIINLEGLSEKKGIIKKEENKNAGKQS